MKILSKILKAIGYIWLFILLATVFVGFGAKGKFGAPEYIVLAIAVVPAIGFFATANWIKKRKQT